MNQPKKILVMRYKFIGDTILTAPFLRNLRNAYPDAQIDMLVTKPTVGVIEDCPYVNNFLYIDASNKFKYEGGTQKKPSIFDCIKMLRKKKYDKAYVLKRSFSSALIAFLSGIKERVGFASEGRSFLLTKPVKYRTDAHESETFLDVLRAEGIEITDTLSEAWIDDETQKFIDEFIEKEKLNDKKIVILHATSGNEKKQWNLQNWAKVLKYLSNEKNVQVMFLGAELDKKIYSEILSLVKSNLDIPPLNLCGELTLKQSMAMTKKVDLLVGCDSGNLHIASAVKTPVIGIYGPMSIKKWGALGDKNILLQSDLPCAPCGLKGKCKNNYACLTSITPEMMIEAIGKVI